jgi:hypothetical protein
MKKINDWSPEVTSLLKRLVSAGFILVKGHNGEDAIERPFSLDALVANLTACDEAHLFIRIPDVGKAHLFLVLGNSPGELVCDYSPDDCEVLDAVLEAHYDAWCGKQQPMKDSA